MSQSTSTRASNVSTALANDRLGVSDIVFFNLSAAAPLTVVAGVVTTGFAVTGVTGIPVSFLAVGLILAVFSIGYVTMARRVPNAGAFYAYISQGLSAPFGVGASWVALLAYNALQVGLYGAIGAVASPLLEDWFGLELEWWVIALVAWALVAVLGVLRVDVNGKILAVLLCAEIAIIMVINVTELANPSEQGVSLSTLSPDNLFVSGVGSILVLGILGFIGFENSVVFSEESRNPRRTVPVAMYTSIALIAVLYALSSWAMTVATGPDNIVASSQQQGIELIFTQAGAHLGNAVVDIGHALFLTSLVAAMISFHNTTARYMFALGRERVLPAAFGRTSARSGAPKVGSIAQSVIGLVVILTYAVAGWDPLVQLFFWGGTSGGLGVLFLITATAVSVLVYLTRNPGAEPLWRTTVAPAVAVIALLIVVYLALSNFATLLGVGPDSPARWIVPVVYLAAALLGIAWGLILRATRPVVYSAIGLGAKSVIVASPLIADQPAQESSL